MHPLLRPIRLVWRLIYPYAHAVIRWLLFPYALLEYAVLIIPHIKDLRHADFVFPMMFGSFGHTASEPHILGMRYKDRKLIILLSDYGNFNRHILHSFDDHADIRWLKHSFIVRTLWKQNFGVRNYRNAVHDFLLPFLLKLMGSKAELILEFCVRDPDQVTGSYISWYIDLMHGPNGAFVSPPEEAIKEFENHLAVVHPQYKDQWFVSLYLRKKFAGKTDVRDTDPYAYKGLIETIIAEGGYVLVGGDYNPHEIFPDLQNIYGYKDFPCNRALCDIYFLTQSTFFVGTHSGPVQVLTAFNQPALITNCAFFYLTGNLESHITVYKKLKEKSTGRILPASELFTRPVVSMVEEQFDEAGFVHIDNTEEELVAAVEEMLDRFVRGKEWNLSTEDQALIDRFRSLLPEKAVAKISPARPAMSYLRSLEWE